MFLQSIEKRKRQYTRLEANHKNLHFNNSGQLRIKKKKNNSGQLRISKEILHVKQSLISSSTEFNSKINSSSNPPLPMDGLNQFSQQKNIVRRIKLLPYGFLSQEEQEDTDLVDDIKHKLTRLENGPLHSSVITSLKQCQ